MFVDTVAWVALLNFKDSRHAAAAQMSQALVQRRALWVTTEFVLLEVADALCAPAIRASTVQFIDGLRERKYLTIIPSSHALLDAGWTLFSQRQDKAWGLTDCINFVVMRDEAIQLAFTADHHFEQAGFTILLK